MNALSNGVGSLLRNPNLKKKKTTKTIYTYDFSYAVPCGCKHRSKIKRYEINKKLQFYVAKEKICLHTRITENTQFIHRNI